MRILRLSIVAVLVQAPALARADLTYTQNFDSLPQAGSASFSLPGWLADETDVTADTGALNLGLLYSYGVAGTNPDTDRALGSVANNSSGDIHYGVKLLNNSSDLIDSVQISFDGEQWRNSGALSQSMVFDYVIGTDAAVTLGAPGVAVPALTFTSPSIDGVAGDGIPSALDGNLNAYRASLSTSITGITWAPGEYMLFRFNDINNTGADHGLAIDNLSITGVAAVPEASSVLFGGLAVVMGICRWLWRRQSRKANILL